MDVSAKIIIVLIYTIVDTLVPFVYIQYNTVMRILCIKGIHVFVNNLKMEFRNHIFVLPLKTFKMLNTRALAFGGILQKSSMVLFFPEQGADILRYLINTYILLKERLPHRSSKVRQLSKSSQLWELRFSNRSV